MQQLNKWLTGSYTKGTASFRMNRWLHNMRLLIGMLVGFTTATFTTPAFALMLDYVGQMAENLEPTRTVVYKQSDDHELLLHVFEPGGSSEADRPPAFITFHGGGWGGFDARRHYPFAAHFARIGLVGISVEYRLAVPGSNITVSDCVKDARSAIRFVRQNATELGIDPARIIVHGNSAGAHLAAGTALFDGMDDAGDDLAVSSAPNALVLFSPVINTSPTGYGNKKIGSDWEALSPLHHIRQGLPPTIVFHGTADTVTPHANSKSFCKAMVQAKNRCELASLDGASHGDLMRDPLLFESSLRQTATFLTSLGLIKAQQAR